MSEREAIAISSCGPVTRDWLKRDLLDLGVQPGMLLMAHISLSRLGWVVGGAETVLQALLDALGLRDPRLSPTGPARAPSSFGTLLMPTIGGTTDPSHWQDPPVPTSWFEIIRAETPAFDAGVTPTRGMGACVELFRNLPGVIRSNHPNVSWAGLGPLAAELLAEHSLNYGLGEDSPMGKCYAASGYVLSLATQRTTILHLAEHRTEYPGKEYRRQGGAVFRGGRREWVSYDDLEGDDSDFEQLRQSYMASCPPGPDSWQVGTTGYGDSRLFAIRPLVDYAVEWVRRNRT